MSGNYAQVIAGELELSERSVSAALELFEDGATIPFVARYRKERTGGLDEVALGAIRDRRSQLQELDARKQTVLASLKDQGIDDPKLIERIRGAATRVEVEDLYLPYRPKRRTRASVARDRGLGELSDRIWQGDEELGSRASLDAAAARFIGDEVPDVEAVLSGVRDILAEQISELPAVRTAGRREFQRSAILSSKRKRGADEASAAKFRDYFEWHERATGAPSHRVLAIQRGCAVGALTSSIRPDEETGKVVIRRALEEVVRLPAKSATRFELLKASEEAYDRLLAPQLETEYRNETVARAETEAVAVFAKNLRELLMSSPLGERPVLAVDPGFRTGCKVVALGASGEFLHFETLYPLEPQRQTEKAADRIRHLVSEYRLEAIAVGNGTGGRETVDFCSSLTFDTNPVVVMVDESGASVYSAGEVARREFPDHDVTVRGAVSIGRRLQDPLAELVKVEPKSIGVGQYQHDVDQKLLASTLEDVVVSCVNAVGVDVNTASAELLRFVSGVSESMARRIVAYRADNGRFSNRSQLHAVSGLGAKTFEQAAGFLRIRDGENPLDASAVHPERYDLVEHMAADLGVAENAGGIVAVQKLVGNTAMVNQIEVKRYVSDDVGQPTIRDILAELAKPGRDPRAAFEVLRFRDGVDSIDHLTEGMRLSGIITNVTNFGAFVDIGVHKDGLVHISKLADHFVKDPHEVVHVHQHVEVTVVSIDKERGRIGLSMVGGENE